MANKVRKVLVVQVVEEDGTVSRQAEVPYLRGKRPAAWRVSRALAKGRAR